MPDRDPALQAALQSASIEASYTLATLDGCRNDGETNDLPPCSECRQAALAVMYEQGPYLFQGGYTAAFRSLGCATPEARAVLREFVEANLELTRQEERLNGAPLREIHDIAKSVKMAGQRGIDARRAFAKLATPPKEGR